MKGTPRLSPSVTEKTKEGNTNRTTMQVNQFSSRNKKKAKNAANLVNF